MWNLKKDSNAIEIQMLGELNEKNSFNKRFIIDSYNGFFA